jgi:hypothetical protein
MNLLTAIMLAFIVALILGGGLLAAQVKSEKFRENKLLDSLRTVGGMAAAVFGVTLFALSQLYDFSPIKLPPGLTPSLPGGTEIVTITKKKSVKPEPIFIVASGVGYFSKDNFPDAPASVRQSFSKKAAKADAMNNLTEQIRVVVKSKLITKNGEFKAQEVEIIVSKALKHFSIISEKALVDGGYQITAQVPESQLDL